MKLNSITRVNLYFLVVDTLNIRVLTYAVYPFIILVYLNTTKSSQPHRLLRPVVTPTSFPTV